MREDGSKNFVYKEDAMHGVARDVVESEEQDLREGKNNERRGRKAEGWRVVGESLPATKTRPS